MVANHFHPDVIPGFLPRRGLRLPDDHSTENRQGKDHDSEVEPGSISGSILGQDEEMDGEPRADGETQDDPDEIAGRLVAGPDVLDLRT